MKNPLDCKDVQRFIRDPDLFRKGGEPICIPGKSNKVVICLHGFNADTLEVHPLTKQLKNFGFSIIAPTLPFMGVKDLNQRLDELKQFNVQSAVDFLKDLIMKLAELGQQVYLYGQSLGGALALIVTDLLFKAWGGESKLDTNPFSKVLDANSTKIMKPFPIKAIALTAPAICLPKGLGTAVNLLGWMNLGCHLEKKNDVFALRAGKEAWKTTKLAQKSLSSIPCPVFIGHTPHDTEIQPNSTEYLSQHLTCPHEVCWYPEITRHTMLLDEENEQVLEDILGFLLSQSHRCINK